MTEKRRKYTGARIGLASATLAVGLCLVTGSMGLAVLEADFLVTTNSAATNVFVGSVGIGTNAPDAELHVVGDAKVGGGLTVSGSMTLPKQGDISMGGFTNGVSEAGSQGALPKGAEGNLLYHNGSAWTSMTNITYDPNTGRLYLGSATNNATYLDTGTGRLVMNANIVLGDNYISRSGSDSGISIGSDGSTSLGGDVSVDGDMDLNPGSEYQVNGVPIGAPVGTVVAWLKSFTNTPALPSGWVECNGQTISNTNSVYNGETLPDLNVTQNRFLRGNSSSGGSGGLEQVTLTISQMPEHNHNTLGATKYYYGAGGTWDFGFAGGNQDCKHAYYTQHKGGGQAHENRPPYYDVVWIMRIF